MNEAPVCIASAPAVAWSPQISSTRTKEKGMQFRSVPEHHNTRKLLSNSVLTRCLAQLVGPDTNCAPPPTWQSRRVLPRPLA